MSTIGYLLDENVDPALQAAIHHRWPDIAVWIIGDPGAPKRGTPDPDLLTWCEANDFILVTNNRASMPDHLKDHIAAGRHVLGIFVLNPKMGFGETAEELALIHGASDQDEYADRVTYLPVS